MLQNPRGFHEGRKFNLAANLQSFKILFLSHTLSKYSLLQFIGKLVTRHICLPNSKLYTQISKKLCYKTRKVLWKFSKISSSKNYPYLFPFFQKYHYHPIYYPSFHHLLKLIIFLLPKKVVGTSFPKIQIKNYFLKRKPQMIQIWPLKKRRNKEVNEDSNSVAYGRSQCLMANERFQCLMAFERFWCLVALERFWCLVILKGSNVWWLMEGSNVWWLLKGFHAWWPMESSNVWWPLKGFDVWWPLEGFNA